MWKKLQAEITWMTFVTFCLHYTLSQVATQTRTFVGKGETTHLLISLVSLMFSVSNWKIFWYATSHLEHFVCTLYNYRYGIQPLRYERFESGKACRKIHSKTRKLISAFYGLPPCRNALNMHKRANHQPLIPPLIWYQVHLR